MRLGVEEAKGQISDIHRKRRGKSEKAREGAHLHTHLCPPLNDRPDLPLSRFREPAQNITS